MRSTPDGPGSPLIFPFIYWLMRNDLEDQMNAGAAERMRELGLPVDEVGLER